MPGVVLAGISGAGKTSTYRHVLSILVRQHRDTLLTLPQAMTTTAHLYLGAHRAAQAAAVLAWYDEAISFAERVTERARVGGLTTHRWARHWTPVFVLEGFVYDLPVHDFAIGREQVRTLEHRIAALDVALIVLVVPESVVGEQCVASTRATRGEGWARHLAALGATDEQRTEHFRAAQHQLRQWARTSPLPTMEIDTAQRRWDDYARQIADLLCSGAPSNQPSHLVSRTQ